MTKTHTFREHLQRAIPVTCDLLKIWSEWWGDMTWPKKKTMTKTKTKTAGGLTWPTKIPWQRQWQRQIHLENTFKEQSQRLVTLETFDQSDEGTWPDQQKDNDKDKCKGNDKDKCKENDKDKYIYGTPSKSDTRDLRPLRNWIRVMTYNKNNDKDKDKDKDNYKDKGIDNPRDLRHLRH